MTHITGPLGFTDMDAEGMLVEGFDQLGTMATIYNYPYYPQHMERLGFEYAESNPELELNGKVQAQWEYFRTEQHKRRRAFIKEIK